MIRKIKRNPRQRVVVVLEGNKASTESTGVAPLYKAIHDYIKPEDQVLVLTLLYWNNHDHNNFNDIAAPEAATLSWPFAPSTSSHVDERIFFGVGNSYEDYKTSDDDQVVVHGVNPDIKFLYVQEIGQRKKAYAEVFKPFYLTCQTYGVKFEVKIAAGFRPQDIVIEEANNAKAKWIVMDRCFAKDPSFQLSRTKCNIISVNDYGEAMFHQKSSTTSDHSSPPTNIKGKSDEQKCQKLTMEQKTVRRAFDLCFSLPPTLSPPSSLSCSPQHEKLKMVAQLTEGSTSSPNFSMRNDIISSRKFHDPNFVLRLPLKLTMEEIEEITFGFSARLSSDESQHFVVFEGFFPVYQLRVLVKMFRGDSGGVFLEAEKKAALSMRHKNIMRLIGYNQSEDAIFLVFPFAERDTLDICILSGLRGREFKLSFHDKLKIAIGIARGLRYMHEECPLGPIVHGKLLLSNVFIRGDLRPQISGFGVATWLHFKQARPILCESFAEKYSSFEEYRPDPDLVTQVKSDVRSFGVLLLRLFCGISVPQDDESLINWARPLLLDMASHVLLDEDDGDLEELDTHEVFRVMCTAFQCAMTKPDKRPCMSQVISYLNGEAFCVMQPSP